MKKVKIITDSCCDLNAKQLEEYDIDYAKMSTIMDGVETPALVTWSEEEIHEFFELMRHGKRITTAQVTTGEYERIFGKYLQEGYDIVYIACSAKLSGSLNTGRLVAEKMMEANPGAKIFCIDSYNSCLAEGLLAIEAAKKAKEGLSAEEIVDYILPIRNNVRQFVTVHTLEYFKRAGRVTASKAFFGNLMGVKPILVSDIYGAQAAYKKARGRQNSIREIVALLKENILDAENQTVYIVHSDADKADVDFLYNLVKEEIPCKNIEIGHLGPIVGCSVGPDTVGVYAFGKEETFDGSAGK